MARYVEGRADPKVHGRKRELWRCPAVAMTGPILWLLAGSCLAAPVVINFDEVARLDGEMLSTQYAGLTFSNATVLTAGLSLDEFEFPPDSGSNVVFDDGGPLMIAFATPVASVFGHFTYGLPSPTRLLFTAFDGFGVPVGFAASMFSDNLALSGESGSVPNELLGVAFASGISAVTVMGDAFGSSFTLDTLTFDRVASVPEPGSLALVALGLVALGRRSARSPSPLLARHS